MKIFINPGHGGEDCGAVSFGLFERDVVLNIGNRVGNYLRAVGYQIKCCQYDGLQTICDDANAFNADLFVSIHCNAFDGNAHGSEVYWSGFSETSHRLATAIQNQLLNSLPLANRGVKSDNLYVLKHTNMPAVLVETAFIDNSDDNQLLRERTDDFAKAIARGVSDFYANQKPLPDVIDKALNNPVGMLGEHFSNGEFSCHCCGQGFIDPRLIELLEELRAKANAPVHVNCGFRCPKHNAEVGGVPNSQHVFGTAADIWIPKISFDSARDLVQSLPFDGTGFYPPLEKGGAWFIHVDVRNGGIGSHIDWWE